VSEIHICRGTGRYYRARMRRPFGRRAAWMGPKRKTLKTAINDMVRQWNTQSGIQYIEADVILCADYYDPRPVAKLTHG
jgi:hypothetical protein